MKSLSSICLALMLATSSLMAQQKRQINPRTLGYSDAVMVSGGTAIYVSGQVPTNDKGELIGKGDLRAQTIQVFENLKKVLAQAGADLENVVKVNTYIVNCKPDDVAVFRAVRKTYFLKDPPASTLVGVTSLVDPGFLIEIEVVAVVN
jgi:enamine deaminase RidA (YjgF/YER057c/UK114 family)